MLNGYGRTVRRVAAGLAMATLLALPAAAQDVTVFAAASLKNALDNINAAWKTEAGKSATISYAASSALAKQIEAGAPADVFISADLDWMAYLSQRNLTKKDTEVELLGNRIVLVAPADSTAKADDRSGLRPAGPARRRTSGDGERRTRFRRAGTARRRSSRSASGTRCLARSPRPRTSAPRWRWSRPARRRSASSTRPTPRR